MYIYIYVQYSTKKCAAQRETAHLYDQKRKNTKGMKKYCQRSAPLCGRSLIYWPSETAKTIGVSVC